MRSLLGMKSSSHSYTCPALNWQYPSHPSIRSWRGVPTPPHLTVVTTPFIPISGLTCTPCRESETFADSLFPKMKIRIVKLANLCILNFKSVGFRQKVRSVNVILPRLTGWNWIKYVILISIGCSDNVADGEQIFEHGWHKTKSISLDTLSQTWYWCV